MAQNWWNITTSILLGLHLISHVFAADVLVTEADVLYVNGSEFNLTCEVWGQISFVKWRFPNDPAIATSDCSIVDASKGISLVECDPAGTGNLSYILNVHSADYKRDDGQFRCEHLGDLDSATIDVTVPAFVDEKTDNIQLEDGETETLFCVTSCGYPQPTLTWKMTEINGSETESLGNDTAIPGCVDKLKRVNSTCSTIGLKRSVDCCLGDSCFRVISEVTTTQVPQTTSGESTITSAAFTSTQTSGAGSGIIIAHQPGIMEGESFSLTCKTSSELVTTGFVNWFFPSQTAFVSSNCSKSIPELPFFDITCDFTVTDKNYTVVVHKANHSRDHGTYQCVVGIALPEEFAIDIEVPVFIATSSDNLVDQGDEAQFVFCNSSCGFPAEVKFTWTGVKTSDEEDLQGFDTTEVDCPGTNMKRTSSTIKVTLVDYVAIKCCAANTRKTDPTEICKIINVTPMCWCKRYLIICIIIIVICGGVPCGVIIGICVFCIKRKKKKCKICNEPEKDCKCKDAEGAIESVQVEPLCAKHHMPHCTYTECKTNAGNGNEDLTTNESTRRSVILPPIVASIKKKKKGKKSHRTPRTEVPSDN